MKNLKFLITSFVLTLAVTHPVWALEKYVADFTPGYSGTEEVSLGMYASVNDFLSLGPLELQTFFAQNIGLPMGEHVSTLPVKSRLVFIGFAGDLSSLRATLEYEFKGLSGLLTNGSSILKLDVELRLIGCDQANHPQPETGVPDIRELIKKLDRTLFKPFSVCELAITNQWLLSPLKVVNAIIPAALEKITLTRENEIQFTTKVRPKGVEGITVGMYGRSGWRSKVIPYLPEKTVEANPEAVELLRAATHRLLGFLKKYGQEFQVVLLSEDEGNKLSAGERAELLEKFLNLEKNIKLVEEVRTAFSSNFSKVGLREQIAVAAAVEEAYQKVKRLEVSLLRKYLINDEVLEIMLRGGT